MSVALLPHAAGARLQTWCPIEEGERPSEALPLGAGEWQLVACCSCGHVYLPNPPGLDFLREEGAWEKTYFEERDRRRAQNPLWHRLEHAWRRLRQRIRPQRRFVRLARSLAVPGTTVVDVGCGWGIEVEALAVAAGVRPVGIELSPGLAAEARKRLAPHGGEVFETDALSGLRALPDGQASLVLMCSFLEHEPKPVAVLRETRRVLRPGGLALIQVPNYGSWNRRVRGARWCGFRHPEHVNYFTLKTLRRAAEHAGLAWAGTSWRDSSPLDDNFRARLAAPGG